MMMIRSVQVSLDIYNLNLEMIIIVTQKCMTAFMHILCDFNKCMRLSDNIV